MGLLLFVLLNICSFFLSLKIFRQPFQIGTSNLVYRFTTTSCIVELKVGFLQFVLLYIYSFFFLSEVVGWCEGAG